MGKMSPDGVGSSSTDNFDSEGLCQPGQENTGEARSQDLPGGIGSLESYFVLPSYFKAELARNHHPIPLLVARTQFHPSIQPARV